MEAVSNAVPNFKEPATKHAKTTLLLLVLIVFVIFGGISVLANIYKVAPIEGKTVLSQMELLYYLLWLLCLLSYLKETLTY